MWHNIVFWVAANFIGITLEAVGDQLSGTPELRQFEVGSLCTNNVKLLNTRLVTCCKLSSYHIFNKCTRNDIRSPQSPPDAAM